MDLVNLCATFWTADQRHEGGRELQTLRRYHDGLRAGGVTAYTWGDLVADYRHALNFWVLMPIQDRAGASSRDYWWPKMQCLASAYQDWDCDSLLEE